jgi:preprotein translocase SecE subunit
MAVAVKNRETTSAAMLDRLPVAIVAGVVYVLVGLAVLFPVASFVWWDVVGPRLSFTRYDTVWWLPLIAIDVALAAGLLVAGRRLLEAHPIKGLRAGIVLGAVGVFLIAQLTVWVGGQLADALFRGGAERIFGLDTHLFGTVLTVAFGVAVLLLASRYFLGESGEKALVALEEQGWFSSAAYKRTQGVRVRRGTILGALVLAGCGIWVLHQNLMKQGGEAAWQVGLPFTAEVVVNWQNVGDNPMLRAELEQRQKPLTEEWESHRQKALGTLRQVGIARCPADVKDRLKEIAKQDQQVARLLEEAPRRTGGAEEPVSPEEEKEVAKAVNVLREPEPGAVLPVDRFALRDSNARFQADYRKVADPGSDPYQSLEPKDGEKFEANTGEDYKKGEVVPRADLEKQQRLRQEKHDQLVEHQDRRVDPDLIVLPKDEDVTPAGMEPVQYRELVLLPHVAYTLPAILAALALWLAWRCVNVPSFGDFLIATEAELNKVSWTTRRRLWQDTVVVLTTVFLMAAFLFAADIVWSNVLKGIGVLQPPPKATDKMQAQPW